MERSEKHGETEGERTAALYVVATPIGHLQDITLRALSVLREVELIAAEDTRVTSRLLAHHGVPAGRLLALHEHNEAQTAPRIIGELAGGRSAALVSDAGTPAFSDPGARLVNAVRAAGFRVVPVPGANAAAAALSVSGFVGARFLFCGFLPAKAGERQRELSALARVPYTLIFYEAPHRIREMVGDLLEAFGGSRRIVLARELTKMFETVHDCALSEAGAWLDADPNRVRGEFVVLVEGAPPDEDALLTEATRTLEVLLEELPVKQAAQLAAKLTGARRNDLYRLALRLKAEGPGSD